MWTSCLFSVTYYQRLNPGLVFNSIWETFINSCWQLPLSAVLIHNGLNSTLLKTIKCFLMNVGKFCKQIVSIFNKQKEIR